MNYSFLLANPDNFRFPKKIKPVKLPRGRPKAVPKEVNELLNAAGFGTNGKEIVVKYKKYLTPEAAAFRFSLLSKQDRQLIGSPELLLSLCRKSYSLLKRRNRLAVPTTFETCFHDIAIEELNLQNVLQ